MKCSKCKTENLPSAKYCRECGTKLHLQYWDRLYFNIRKYFNYIIEMTANSASKEFTLDKFSTIPFQPVSIISIRFINRSWLGIGLLLTIFLLAFYCISDVRYLFRDMLGEDDYYTFRDILPIAFIPLALICLFLLVSLYKKIRFQLNADYIENNYVSDFSRIAKDCKLGLFNNKNKRIILSSRYDSIEKFDANHLIIERNGKKGLFSIERKRIIIPVSFDCISAFSNSVATANNGSIVAHYDVKGNKLR